jgi:hypothetical protein
MREYQVRMAKWGDIALSIAVLVMAGDPILSDRLI